VFDSSSIGYKRNSLRPANDTTCAVSVVDAGRITGVCAPSTSSGQAAAARKSLFSSFACAATPHTQTNLNSFFRPAAGEKRESKRADAGASALLLGWWSQGDD
jgi:hypothetical protein